MKRRAAWIVFGLVTAAGCTGSVMGTGASGTTAGGTGASTSASTTSTATTSTGNGGTGGCTLGTPTNHRAEATPCPPSTPADTPCASDTDCTMGDGFGGIVMGKCDTVTMTCEYDQCTTDGDCPAASDVCACQGETHGDGEIGSVCVESGCHIDADCGAGGFCSPSGSVSCGDGLGTVGWYCHTCSDACVNDADCMTAGMPPASCVYDPTVGHWTCSTGICSG
jgi:hypothetical protein